MARSLRKKRPRALAKAIGDLIEESGASRRQIFAALRATANRLAAEVVGDSEEASFARVQLRSATAEAELLEAEGGSLGGSHFAPLCGAKSLRELNKWDREGRVFSISASRQTRVFPSWQIHGGKMLPGLEDVLSVLRDRGYSRWGIASFFLTPAESLGGRSPLKLLRSGSVHRVLKHARYDGTI